MAQTLICDCGSFGNEYFQIGTWLIIILGWFIVNYLHNKRELRRESRAQLDAFNTSLSSVERKAIEYHLKLEHDEILARELKRQLDEIRKLSIRLGLVDTKAHNLLIIKLRKSITFDNFDNCTNHKQENENGELIAGIYDSCDDFIDKMESGFKKKH